MPFKKLMITGAAVLLLSGCSDVTIPVAVTIPNSAVMKGTRVDPAVPNETSIQFTNGVLTCSGANGSLESIPVTCSDGRKGLVTGSVLTLNDGTTAQVFEGDAANAF